MKVIYEKDIIEKINEALYEAANNNKKIEEIHLTRGESIEFAQGAKRMMFHRVTPRVKPGENWPTVMSFSGVKICITLQDNEDF